MKRTVVVALAVCVAITVVSSPGAAASERKGLVLGLGVGGGFTWQKASFDPMHEMVVHECAGTVCESGLVSDFKLGWAPTNRLQLYWTAKVAWLNQTNSIWIDECTVASGLGGIGATYYFEDVAPSLFWSAGVGYSNWVRPFEEDPENLLSTGWYLGVGYEFHAHWAVEFDVLWVSPDDELDESYMIYRERDVTSMRALLTFTLY